MVLEPGPSPLPAEADRLTSVTSSASRYPECGLVMSGVSPASWAGVLKSLSGRCQYRPLDEHLTLSPWGWNTTCILLVVGPGTPVTLLCLQKLALGLCGDH